MDLLLEKLWNYVAQDRTLTLQVRLFRLITLATCILCLCVILPVNMIEVSLPLVVNLACIGLGVFALFCYSMSCRGKHWIGLFISVLTGSLAVVWFFNGGIDGSINSNFFPVFLLAFVFYRGRKRWLTAGAILLTTCGVMVVGYLFPALVTPFQNRFDQTLDWITGMVAICGALTLVAWVAFTSYDREQERLSCLAKELATGEENYRSVVENVMSIILRLDAEGRITFINRYGAELFGYRREEMVGRAVVGFIVPAISSKGENLAARISELLQDPAKFPLSENENVCRDGRRLWITWTNQPVRDSDGRLKEILCVGADVTQRVALLEQLRLTQITMDAAAEQIVWTDSQGRIIYANAAAISVFGYSDSELRMLLLTELFTDLPAEKWGELWTRFKRDQFATLELIQRFKDGRTRPAELSISYIQVAGKEYTTVFIRDLTGRIQNEEKRREHERQMQHLQRLESLGLLAGGIAHDFNNLLTAVLANISLVKMELPPSSENHEVLAEAEKASLQARGLTGQLLTFAKGGRPVKAAVNLEQVIRDSSGFALRGKPVKADIQSDPSLHPVDADAGQLTQVFNNLVINACQAMPDGGHITIRTRNRTITQADQLLLADGNYVEITFHDDGAGIPTEHIGRVFDPYFTTKASGSGLGLAVVHSIITNHQGHVAVESVAGRGTTFTLLLPASQQQPATPVSSAPAPSQQHRRILIMDDDAMVSRVLGKILGRLGYEAEVTPDGETAINCYQRASAEKNPFDLVIVDLTVPGGMGGRETIRRLRELDPKVRAIVSSGYSHDPVLAEYQAHGFCGVIQKPYTQELVANVVRKALESS
jgi:PAS domain S-box-containing protein